MKMKHEKIIGVIAGNFDVLHPGYIFLFNECKRHCDHFLLLLHEDPSVERSEKLKPILNIEERKLILSSLRQIDEIITYKTELDLFKILQDKKIDIRFLGDDYKEKKFTGMELGIPIHFLDRSHGWSATKLKKLLVKNL
jgi:glycerol-3-phosphate cytidylyltransferase|tara:strand:- start:64 stop:480 length:417 start_codon:yes stop_codon:yes gene_type:complete